MKHLTLSLHWLRRYWSETIRVLTFIMAIAILIFGITAYTNSQHNSTNQLQQIKSLTAQNKELSVENTQILEQLKTLATDINTNTSGIHQQINCVLQFFSQAPTNRTNSTVTSANPCIITTSSLGGATGTTKSG